MKAAQWVRRLPWSVVLAYCGLLALGLTAIDRVEDWAGGSGTYVRRQAVWAALSLVVMLLATIPNYRILHRWSYGLFLASIPLLLAVYFFGPINGAHRWIRLGSISLQPSEFAKLAFVLALSRYLMYRENHRRLWGLIGPLSLTLIPTALILKEPDLGTALLFFPVLFLMLFAAGARLRHLALTMALGLTTVPMFWTQLGGEQRSRITSWLSQQDRGERPRGSGYQLYQSKLVLGLGGVWGSEWPDETGDGDEAYHLPEAHTDFVFSVVGHRWGIFGAAMVLLLFAIVVLRGLKIARRTREPFGRLVAVGIVSLLCVQVLINTGMTVGLVPITGLTLPALSYGGSSLLATGLALGVLLNIGIRPGYEVTREPFRFPR